jgi:hypothetical protein
MLPVVHRLKVKDFGFFEDIPQRFWLWDVLTEPAHINRLSRYLFSQISFRVFIFLQARVSMAS